jgi:hypothetical protein
MQWCDVLGAERHYSCGALCGGVPCHAMPYVMCCPFMCCHVVTNVSAPEEVMRLLAEEAGGDADDEQEASKKGQRRSSA